jgi:hypothetical protein
MEALALVMALASLALARCTMQALTNIVSACSARWLAGAGWRSFWRWLASLFGASIWKRWRCLAGACLALFISSAVWLASLVGVAFWRFLASLVCVAFWRSLALASLALALQYGSAGAGWRCSSANERQAI